ncbi:MULTISPECIES: hypothetical protein [unclassified Streptomyces]|uniref:hypothetical protein n=1 Tax=unclassified Streptomyces TaxID=2593676 RepID=UPI0004C62AF8|nr:MULTISPECIES: hypothetical protein [unclassified Streptomyces]KOV71823.1 hypothetical protein ADL02_45270 [Streptomyces sp. NRRL WC-3723]
MSDSTPTPPMPSFPPPPPAPMKSRTNLVIIGSAAAVIAAVIATGVVVVQATNDDSKPAAATKASTPAAEPASEDTEESTPTYADLDTDSFSIDLKTKSRQCFGSAGCNLTVEPDLTLMVDSSSVDPDAVYEITYEIRGDQSGPVIDTAELSNQTSLNYTPSLIQTASAGTKVTAKITDVTKQG